MPEERNDQEEVRRQRRQELIEQLDLYPARVARTTTISTLLADWQDSQNVTIVGRVRAIRAQGASMFVVLEDETGRLQCFLQTKHLGPAFVSLVEHLDLGDFLQIAGTTFITKRGEKTVDGQAVTWLGKALRPLPSSWHGLSDIETRYRYRELDTLTNEESKKIFILRSRIVQSMRQFLVGEGFMEVETPILHPIAGGATAKPFVTHHNSLNKDFFLRIAPELYLKRLLVGGFGRVFEIGRNFRNEGIDRDHNPEFTMMECYAAYTDYEWMMQLTEKMLRAIAQEVLGTTSITIGESSVDLVAPFQRQSYHQAIQSATNLDIDTLSDSELLSAGRALGTDLPDGTSRSKMVDEIFKTNVRPKLLGPIFIYDYPAEMIPLAKKKFANPKYVECVQLLLNGTEVTKAFSELNDPIDQRERFETQEKMRAAGDEEAQPIDETYLRSLEYGLPPTGGLGLGVDRLVAILCNQKTLKDVLLFPTLKPE